MKTRIESLTHVPKLGIVVFNKYESTSVPSVDGYVFKGTFAVLDTTENYASGVPFDPQVSAFVKRMKSEIRAHIDEGLLPDDVNNFGDLNDWVDANAYGGFCDDGVASALILKFGGRDTHYGMPEGMLAFINDCQEAIDKWLQEGRPE